MAGTTIAWPRRELLGVQDGYDLPEPQLPAKAGAASQADVDKAAAQAAKKAAAELAEAQAEAGLQYRPFWGWCGLAGATASCPASNSVAVSQPVRCLCCVSVARTVQSCCVTV